MATPSGFPVRTHETSITIAGLRVSLIASLYADRIMFILTHVGTLGTMVHAQKETVLGGGTTFSTATLLGARDDPVPELCARQLVERLSQSGCDLPVLLCLGLQRGLQRENTRDLVQGVVDGCVAAQSSLMA